MTQRTEDVLHILNILFPGVAWEIKPRKYANIRVGVVVFDGAYEYFHGVYDTMNTYGPENTFESLMMDIQHIIRYMHIFKEENYLVSTKDGPPVFSKHLKIPQKANL